MSFFEDLLGDGLVSAAAVIFLVLVSAVGLYFLMRLVVLPVVSRLVRATQFRWDDLLTDRKVRRWLALFTSASFVYLTSPIIPGLDEFWAEVWLRGTAVVAIFFGTMALGAILYAFNTIYEELPVSRELPIKGYIQILVLVLYLFGDIWVLSVITDQSPWFFLSGLGAAAAVLLVFYRDPILNFVASTQLAQNDMLRVGDWIEVKRFGADGTVIDVALATVKVQNWDNSITTIPTHKLVSEPFRNWRGMWEAGIRRIKRSINIDISSIRFLNDDDVKQFLPDGQLVDGVNPVGLGDGWVGPGQPVADRPTNLDAFSSHMVTYLRSRQHVDSNLPLLVRQLTPGQHGLPLEIYAFSNQTDWQEFEAIQAGIIGYALAVMPEFGLRPYQVVSGLLTSSELTTAGVD